MTSVPALPRFWTPTSRRHGLLSALLMLSSVGLAGCPLFGDGDGDFGPCIGPGCLCDTTSDCSTGMICSAGGTCIEGCRTDGDCEAGFACGSDNSCSAATTCSGSDGCGTDRCDFRDTCVTPAAGSCGSDSDCSAGEVCVESSCQAREDVCQFSSDCAAGRECVNNRCAVVCGGGASCGAGESCQDGFCQADPSPVHHQQRLWGAGALRGRPLPSRL